MGGIIYIYNILKFLLEIYRRYCGLVWEACFCILLVTRDAMGQYIVPTDGKPLTSLGKSICRSSPVEKKSQFNTKIKNMHSIYLNKIVKWIFYEKNICWNSVRSDSATYLFVYFFFYLSIHQLSVCMHRVISKIQINVKILINGSKGS